MNHIHEHVDQQSRRSARYRFSLPLGSECPHDHLMRGYQKHAYTVNRTSTFGNKGQLQALVMVEILLHVSVRSKKAPAKVTLNCAGCKSTKKWSTMNGMQACQEGNWLFPYDCRLTSTRAVGAGIENFMWSLDEHVGCCLSERVDVGEGSSWTPGGRRATFGSERMDRRSP